MIELKYEREIFKLQIYVPSVKRSVDDDNCPLIHAVQLFVLLCSVPTTNQLTTQRDLLLIWKWDEKKN